MRLRFSQEARAHLFQIHAHIAQHNPAAAVRVIERIRAATELLREFPHIGHEGRDEGTREWVVRGLPYIVVYEVGVLDADDMVVLAVFHGSQDR